jgi:hypothetical protein
MRLSPPPRRRASLTGWRRSRAFARTRMQATVSVASAPGHVVAAGLTVLGAARPSVPAT